jgi:hypothetical protein
MCPAGAWLSYENNLLGYLRLVDEIGIWGFLRGFATNVANYQARHPPTQEPGTSARVRSL